MHSSSETALLGWTLMQHRRPGNSIHSNSVIALLGWTLMQHRRPGNNMHSSSVIALLGWTLMQHGRPGNNMHSRSVPAMHVHVKTSLSGSQRHQHAPVCRANARFTALLELAADQEA
jgi:hypothetical protein